jgi:phosphatidyl-myo-inositol dimannoside synthase
MMMLVSVISGAGFGGIQMVNRLMSDAINQAEIRGTIISLHDSPDAEWRHQWTDSFCAGGSKTRFLLAALSHRRHARRSVIIVSHINLAAVGRMVKHITGARLYAFAHGVEAWRPLPADALWGMRACDRVLTNSRFTLGKFREANPTLSAIPGQVIYLPARKLGNSNGTPVRKDGTGPRVLIVGRLWGRGLVKGQRQLIEIWPEVVKEFPEAELLIVGDGEGRCEFEELARQRGVVNRVRFTGEIADGELETLYASSDIYAMPSCGEGFGLVFAEAMSHGLPCIASRLDAGSEVVTDGETGIHVAPDSHEELLGALRKLLRDESLRRRMGEAARRRAKDLFSLDRFNKSIEEVLLAEKLD